MKYFIFFIFFLCTCSLTYSMESTDNVQNDTKTYKHTSYDRVVATNDLSNRICATIAEIPPFETLLKSSPDTIIDALGWFSHVEYPFVVNKTGEPFYGYTGRVSSVYSLGYTSKNWYTAVKYFFNTFQKMRDKLAAKIDVHDFKIYYDITSQNGLKDTLSKGRNRIDVSVTSSDDIQKDSIFFELLFSNISHTLLQEGESALLETHVAPMLLKKLFGYTVECPKRFYLLVEFIKNCTSIEYLPYHKYMKYMNIDTYLKINFICHSFSILPLIAYMSQVQSDRHIVPAKEMGNYALDEYKKKITYALDNACSLEEFFYTIQNLEKSCFLLPTKDKHKNHILKKQLTLLIKDIVDSYFKNEHQHISQDKRIVWKHPVIMNLILTLALSLLEDDSIYIEKDVKAIEALKEFLYEIALWEKPFVRYILYILETLKYKIPIAMCIDMVHTLCAQLEKKEVHTHLSYFIKEQYNEDHLLKIVRAKNSKTTKQLLKDVAQGTTDLVNQRKACQKYNN